MANTQEMEIHWKYIGNTLEIPYLSIFENMNIHEKHVMSTLDLINPVYGWLIGGVPFKYCIALYYDYWRGNPLINKPWFSLIRG